MEGVQKRMKERMFPLYTKPIQRQKWGDHQLHPVVNWGDLFFDLFYVGMAYNLGNIIRESPTTTGLLYFCGCFVGVLHIWLDKMYYDSRFYTRDDLWHRFCDVGLLVTLATAVLFIRSVEVLSNPREHKDIFAFCLAVVIASGFSLIRYVEIMIGCEGQPVAKVAAWRDFRIKLIPFSLQLAAMSVAAYEHYGEHDDYSKEEATDDHRVLAEPSSSYPTTDVPIWLLLASGLSFIVTSVILILTMPGGGKHKEISVPMNIDFCIHRYGEWTMLMLGESVLSLLIVEISPSWDYYVTFYMGIISVVLLQYLHFRSQPHHADDHAMRRSKEAGYTFSLLMQIYSAALIILGVSYKMFLYEYTLEEAGGYKRSLFGTLPRWLAGGGGALKFSPEDRQQRIAIFFCGSLATVFLCSDMMILAHKGLQDNLGRCRVQHGSGKVKSAAIFLSLLRVGVVVFTATLQIYETDPEYLAIIGLGCILAELILRVVGTTVFPDDEIHAEEGLEHGHEISSEPNENKWPNVTEAQALPAEETEHDTT